VSEPIRVADFDYELPPERIAQQPLTDRSAARLLVLDRATGRLQHRVVRELPSILRAGDLLVMNDSKVIPARLTAQRPTGGRVELLLLHPLGSGGGLWRALVRRASRQRPGQRLRLVDRRQGPQAELGPTVELIADRGAGEFDVRLEGDPDPATVLQWLQRYGEVPLPPYIRTPLGDPDRYQTVYARREGSVAAPTAGLHFTAALLRQLAEQGVQTSYLTLHVGAGTFRPVQVERVQEHRMHAEWFELPPETVAAIGATKERGGRVVAVGTTVTRVLEAQALADGVLKAGSGWTDLFIYPGFRFRVTDALLTNFHLPRSTLLMLVSAFAGRERVLDAYRQAVAAGYRFYSLGDAMLIL